jgi:hypothetical protein
MPLNYSIPIFVTPSTACNAAAHLFDPRYAAKSFLDH